MKNIKVLIAPSLEIAQTVSATATVEAEYGGTVVQGEIVTLGHHGDRAADPAPCIAQDVPVLPEGSTILVSHVDLDTIGGIMQLVGCYTDDPDFWNGAAFIDLNGQHHLHELSKEVTESLQAYWAWAATNGRVPQLQELTDITELVDSHIRTVTAICEGDTELMAEGQLWAWNINKAREACLIEETVKCRVFVTNDFALQCPTAYYSSTLKQIVPVTATLNTSQASITLGCCDGSVDVCNLAQELWGPEAGGRPSVAGSPRGRKMSVEDLTRAAFYINHN